MRLLSLVTLFGLAAFAAAFDKEKPMNGPLAHKMKGIDGKEIDLASYKGKVVLIVNVASRCGATPQYAGLQKLFDTYSKEGFVLLGVPCNQFGKQEPGSEEDIQKFCSTKYNVTFPMTAKVDVNGDGACDLYKFLTSKESGFEGKIGWNFEKFLVGKDGKVVARFKTGVEPDAEELVKAVKAELAKK